MNHSRRYAVAAVATIVALALTRDAESAVLCAKKRSGAVFLRTACKKKETQIDPSQFGAVVVGEKGEQGPPGTPGTPGAPGLPGENGTARAYASVVFSGVNNTPVFESSRTKGSTAVSRCNTVLGVLPGCYCLTLPAEIDASTVVPVAVAAESGGGFGTDTAITVKAVLGVNSPFPALNLCPANSVGVSTRDDTTTVQRVDDAPFVVAVP